MNEQQQQLLAQLKGIHPPPDAAFWPLAWGWWVLLAVLVAALVGAVILWRRHRRFNAARRQAMDELRQVSSGDNNWPSQLNQILKRTALVYYPPATLSGLYGQRWTQFLLAQLKRGQQQTMAARLEHLQAMQYQPAKPDKQAFDPCQEAAISWVKKARFQQAAHTRGSTHTEVSHV
ncbi:DUF4381 domain-containing protein [Salinimonas sediminis]|uniref:DUF4381 domain-containing protein n=1 Tax=Salinimonas sediminis TaxID=2303538 RepID=A0A346NK48_9ALTE|nr:DUF4381 domain-containing protein [Salinimonas sediminis]AXR05905.1 DUF4381 domain-containing protein [Salinimonas sediminis]